jgi:hypothetical protein
MTRGEKDARLEAEYRGSAPTRSARGTSASDRPRCWTRKSAGCMGKCTRGFPRPRACQWPAQKRKPARMRSGEPSYRCGGGQGKAVRAGPAGGSPGHPL